ncbi:uncharacterized protein LOC136092591 [Hydra vulgaris]|uniref:uncharacterized protein LOC136092591 n=1 Tax=Hydra vulgaris TaxID=6087 RepID=UPI0032EA2AFC
MLIVEKKVYKKNFIDGSGIFSPFRDLLNNKSINNALKISRNLANKAIASDLGKTAIDAAKVAGKELATNAISTAKDIILEKGNKLIKKSKLKPESKQVLANLVEYGANDLDQNISNEVTTNINKLMMGSAILSKRSKRGLNKKLSHSNAIKLEELVKMGRGLKMA